MHETFEHLNCGRKIKWKKDFRSYLRNLSSWKKEGLLKQTEKREIKKQNW